MFEEFEALPRGFETPNVYGPADAALEVQQSQLLGSVRKNDYAPFRRAYDKDALLEATKYHYMGASLVLSSVGNAIPRLFTQGCVTTLELELTLIYGSFLDTNLYFIDSSANFNFQLTITRSGNAVMLALQDLISAEILTFLTISGVGGTTTAFYKIVLVFDNVSNNLCYLINVDGKTKTGNSPLSPLLLGEMYAKASDTTTLTMIQAGVQNSYSIKIYSGNTLNNSRACIRSYPYIPQTPILPSKVGIPALKTQAIKTVRTSQPQGSCEIDRGNPLGAKIVYASKVSGGCFDLVKNRFPVAVSAVPPTISVNAAGVAGEFVTASSQYYSITTATNLVPSYPLTVACWARIDSVTAGGCLYSLNGTGYSAILGLLSAAFLVNQASAASTNIASYSNTGLHHIVCIHRATSYSLYVDGALLSQNAGSNYWSSPAAGNHSIGNRLNGSSPQYFDGAIQDLYVFKGELSEVQAKSLYQNHWQIFKPHSHTLTVGNNTLPPLKVYREKLMVMSQPQYAAEIDWSNPITRGLVSLVNPSAGGDVLSREISFTSGSNTSLVASKDGIGLTQPIGTSGYYGPRGKFGKANVTGFPLSIFVCAKLGGNVSENGIIFGVGDGVNGGFSIGKDYYYPLIQWKTDSQTGSISGYSTSKYWDASGLVHGAVLSDACRVYSDGKNIITAGAPAGNLIYDTNYGHLNIFGNTLDGLSGSTGKVYWGGVWNRALSDAEIKSLSANPWQIFKGVSRPVVNTVQPKKPQPLLPKYNLVRKQQPQNYGTIDWSNPISHGLVDILLPGYNQPVNGVSSTGVTSLGKAVPLDYKNKTEMSVLLIAQAQTPLVLYESFFYGNGTSYLNIGSDINGKIGSLYWEIHGPTWNTNLLIGQAIIDFSKPRLLVGTWRANEVANLYLEGIPVTNISPNTTTLCGENTGTGATTGSLPGNRASLYLRWNRKLTQTEISSISANPWQIFKPTKYPARLK